MIITGHQILEETDKTIGGQRQVDYGDAVNCFDTIAKYWSTTLSAWFKEPCEIPGELVGLMMIDLKKARQICGEGKLDNYIDMCGYAALAGQMYTVRKENEKHGSSN